MISRKKLEAEIGEDGTGELQYMDPRILMEVLLDIRGQLSKLIKKQKGGNQNG